MNVFISYRRADTKDVAGRLADRLRSSRLVSDVFIDVNEIEGGKDFLNGIRTALKRSQIRYVLIGPSWTTIAGADGQPRLRDPQDTVALEVRESLNSEGRTIPVLVNGTAPLTAEDVPADLSELLRLHALPLRHESFESDFEQLLAAGAGRKVKRGGGWFSSRPGLATLVWGACGLVASAFAGVLILIWNSQSGAVPLPLGGSSEAANVIVAIWLGAGALIPAIWRLTRRRV